jgi:hypothetical protein
LARQGGEEAVEAELRQVLREAGLAEAEEGGGS